MKLLVSVRSVAEAEIALAAGVDLLDIKEPSAGSLGAAAPGVIAEISRMSLGEVPLSAALGELRDLEPGDLSSSALAGIDPGRLQFAKVGLAGLGTGDEWPAQWRAFGDSLPPGVQPVAVAYADWNLADAPPIEAILDQALEFGWGVLLIDTFDKGAGDLLAHVAPIDLQAVIDRAHAAGTMVVLAGSLRRESLAVVGQLPRLPDFLAVRGAVCRDRRDSQIVGAKIEQLKQRMARICMPSAIGGR